MQTKIETVGELCALLERMAPDAPLRVVPVPDVSGHASQILDIHGGANDGVCYLALGEQSLEPDEVIFWFDRDDKPARPI